MNQTEAQSDSNFGLEIPGIPPELLELERKLTEIIQKLGPERDKKVIYSGDPQNGVETLISFVTNPEGDITVTKSDIPTALASRKGVKTWERLSKKEIVFVDLKLKRDQDDLKKKVESGELLPLKGIPWVEGPPEKESVNLLQRVSKMVGVLQKGDPISQILTERGLQEKQGLDRVMDSIKWGIKTETIEELQRRKDEILEEAVAAFNELAKKQPYLAFQLAQYQAGKTMESLSEGELIDQKFVFRVLCESFPDKWTLLFPGLLGKISPELLTKTLVLASEQVGKTESQLKESFAWTIKISIIGMAITLFSTEIIINLPPELISLMDIKLKLLLASGIFSGGTLALCAPLYATSQKRFRLKERIKALRDFQESCRSALVKP